VDGAMREAYGSEHIGSERIHAQKEQRHHTIIRDNDVVFFSSYSVMTIISNCK
jgi:hypothetical protein